jgi:hypothetical protein
MADRTAAPPQVTHVVRCARAIGRRVRRANCLVQSLAVFEVLRREHIAVELRIGVAGTGSEEIRAHSWLLFRGAVVLGDDVPLEQFVPLAFFSSDIRR